MRYLFDAHKPSKVFVKTNGGMQNEVDVKVAMFRTFEVKDQFMPETRVGWYIVCLL